LTNGVLFGIAWSGSQSQFVAVGQNYSTNAPAILTSPNGINCVLPAALRDALWFS
jgi:hypothetical protein